MRKVTRKDFETICQGSQPLTADQDGVKVLRLADGRLVKLFRRHRRLSSAFWRPYAVQFVNNAEGLRKSGFRTVEVLDVFNVPTLRRHAVLYRPLPGQPLDEVFADAKAADRDDLLRQTAEFLADLHRRGVYFRSLHLGNIILTPDRHLGLIDVADLRLKGRPLTLRERKRNWRHFLGRPCDRCVIERFGLHRFVCHYASASGLPLVKSTDLVAWMKKQQG